jgi:predicted DNA-binding transcriptional regulator YafY
MPPVGKHRQFEVINTVLALAEETDGGVGLEHAAAEVDMDPAALKDLLEMVLYLEYRDAIGVIVDETRAFLFTEDGRITVTDDHWLRSLAARPPAPLTALRLLAAGTVAQVLLSPNADLDRAVRKLDAHLQSSVLIPVDRPPSLDVAEAARREGVSLRIRYTNDAGDTTDREIEPWHVMANWGKWYVQGPEVGDGTPKWWRVDRMVSAEVGDVPFEATEPLDIPEVFDVSHAERTVRLRLPRATLDNLPTPHRIDDLTDEPDDSAMVIATITVTAEHRLDHLLVAAGPDAEVLDPPEYAARRRAHAAKLLSEVVGTLDR